eukprot:CAMPEP_0167785524 /NCGR_PEP_ID=MMETSP0111_2-20121227/8281_1 /TAXON_ID=91324 /ORGANISM="Lotharella globosa, Strain CCCM811" /LENGTH=236 /DNA_ID=CAMNT_0007676797 /DNA_START=62 /DNA_END=772 /DNA_ORIENTATION=+
MSPSKKRARPENVNIDPNKSRRLSVDVGDASSGKPSPLKNLFLDGSRWALSPFCGSKREAGAVNPFKMAKMCRERLTVVMFSVAQKAVKGDKSAAAVVIQESELKVNELQEIAKAPEQEQRDQFEKLFRIYIKNLIKQTRCLYDSKGLCKVKWINLLPTFQSRFGVSACNMEDYIKTIENVEKLKGLYQYFFCLYLDTLCFKKHREKWNKMFPKKRNLVLDEDLDIGHCDAFEDFC